MEKEPVTIQGLEQLKEELEKLKKIKCLKNGQIKKKIFNY